MKQIIVSLPQKKMKLAPTLFIIQNSLDILIHVTTIGEGQGLNDMNIGMSIEPTAGEHRQLTLLIFHDSKKGDVISYDE